MAIQARILVRAVDNPGDAGRKDLHQKGHIVSVVPGTTIPGAKETLPNFVWVNVTTSNYQTIKAYWQSWKSRLIWTTTSLNTSLDRWNVNLQMTNVTPSGYGNLTKAKVDNALSEWNISTNLIGGNEVDFNARIYNLARSSEMLGGVGQSALDSIDWSEIYIQGTGDHEITGDYSSTAFTPEQAAKAVSGTFTIDDHDTVNKIITYTANRAFVFDQFKVFAEDALNQFLGKSRYKISVSDVDLIIAAGGTIEQSATQVLAKVVDRIATE